VSPTARPLEPGVWGILATPFRGPDCAVDLVSFARQFDLYRSIGAQGVVSLGVFGEAVKLDPDEQRAVIDATAGAAGDDLRVVIGLTPLATRPTLAQARTACEGIGDTIAGLMVQVNASQSGPVVEHLTALHEATGAGIVLQDYPLISGVHISAEALLEVVHDCPFVVAVKAEAPPTPPVIAHLTANTDVPVFGGLGGVGLIDELAAGAAGAMTGFSHPEGLVAAVEAYRQGGFAAAREAFEPWLPIANFEGQAGIGLALRKEILRQRGILDEATIRRPGRPFPESLRETMQSHLAAVRTT
jgi:4-hydroxy-tetrahydrodipicolinate synthase